MEQYMFLGIHIANGSTTGVMRDIFSMDHHGEYVNLMVSGVETNLPVKVRNTLNGITQTVDTSIHMYSNTHTRGMRFHKQRQ